MQLLSLDSFLDC